MLGVWNWWRKLSENSGEDKETQKETASLQPKKASVATVKEQLQNIDDVIYRKMYIGTEEVSLFFVDSLVDKKQLQETVFDPLTGAEASFIQCWLQDAEKINQDFLSDVLQSVLSGYTVLFFPVRNLIIRVDTFGPPERSITTSESESTVLGPQDSFTESLQTNLSLIKRRLKSVHLKTKIIPLGTETNGSVSVLYMENIANEENVQRALFRIQNVEFQGFVGMSMLKQAMEDKPYSPFPQFGMTQRPDNAVASLLDGRIIIMLDGSPEAIICPSTFFEMFSSPEDFYNRWTTASLLRCIRFFGFFLTILLTPTYVSVLTYHQEMLPTPLLTLLTESRSKVPFPPLLEALGLELVIDILREAGTRMPTKIGQTIGIVGGIVIGTAAVEAGLASNILIVVVAISALLSFLPSNFLLSNASRFIRYWFIIAAGLLGIYGQTIALAWLFAHLLNLTSLGTPYMTPVIPRSWTDLQNGLLRAPISFLFRRAGASRAKRHFTRPLDEE